ncbi:MAG TPA: low-specificity L-threonine aldolase [Thermomicrobiales bacterium]|nr:low-specificity L-threonine aldolase [Thermomicrobiales bacterium]
MSLIDLRSDTVTQPTAAMREAMANAVVGDDQYGEDPTVHELEALAAKMLGKEAAVYVASGTMGNLVSLLAHCGRGDEIIMGDECHIFWYESGGAAALGGMPFNLLPNGPMGELDLERVRKAIRATRPGYPRTGVISIENTQNRCGGTVLPLDYLGELHELASSNGVPVHMDGARIFNAAAAIDTPAEEIARHADSVQFCLSKGLAAPVGSVVAGSAEFIQRARAGRKIVGGAMRQSGVIAAAGLVALQTMVDRLPEDHRRARRLAEGLAEIDGISIDLDAVQTNIVIFNVEPNYEQAAFVEAMKRAGIMISNYGTRGVRMVTHYQIDDAAIETALNAAREVLGAKLAAA